MHLPTNARPIQQQTTFRLALQGPSGSGKTYSALTFPNPVVANFDNNLVAFAGSKDILEIPFHDPTFCDTLAKRTAGKNMPPNKRDAFFQWLSSPDAHSLTSEQTLLVDSWTTLQDGFDKQTELEPMYTTSGKIDEFAFWGRKQEWSRDVLGLLGSLRCNVVVTFHETPVTDDKGTPTGKILPLMQGKFVSKLGLYFTDWFRCVLVPVKQRNASTGKDEVVSIDRWWQTRSDLAVDCKTRVLNCPPLLSPNYAALLQAYNASKNLGTTAQTVGVQ